MNNKKINIIILVIAIILVFYFTLKDNFLDIIKELSKVNVLIFIVAILIFILSLWFKSLSLHLFIKEQNKKYKLKKTFELTLISQFLNGITPFQSGGQPFEIYLLKKDGVRISDSTGAMIKDFISFQIALILFGVISIIINSYLNIIPYKSKLILVIALGFFINVIVLIFLILTVNAKKFSIKLVNKLLNFISKLSKRININKSKINDGLINFYNCASDLKKNKKYFILAITTNLINLCLLYTVPFIIFKSMNYNDISILVSIVLTSFVMLIGNFVPIPGATGGIEYGFISFFSRLNISFPVLSGAMLLWRFVTYFFGMFIGFISLLLRKGVDKKCV